MQMPTNTISKGLQPKGFEKSMGLAASQARFLGLTARKANCEFKSTELAEEKLNLSNQMSQISNDYFNALNATKLTWQNEVVEGAFGVSYGILMTPSALNDYNPYMVTTKSGAVVLTNEFINAAKAAGINMGGGAATQEGRDKFINALINQGVITAETAKLITKDDYDKNTNGIKSNSDDNYILWNSTAGVGGPVLDKNEVDGMNISDLMYSDSIGKKVLEWNKAFDGSQNKILETSSSNITTTKGNYSVIKNGAVINSQGTLNNMTIADLLSNNIILMVRNKNDENDKENLVTTNDFANTVLSFMRPVFECLGLDDSTHTTGLNIDDAADEALDYAYKMIRNVYLRAGNTVKLNNETNNESLSKNSAYQNAVKNNRIGQDEKGIYSAVSLSNIMSAFLTYFDNYVMGMAGEASNFSVAKTVDLSSYVTENTGYIYYGQSQDGALTTEEKIADFYDELYNNICSHGWREDDTISNDENLSAAIKDGRYVLSVLHDDGYFYQTNYVNLDYLVEVADKDAIARAEAEFTRKKAEITSKENAIDIKAKKLDAEIAELTSELNSVQNLIQEGASVFKQFQS